MMVSIWAIICLTVLARAWTLEFPGILPLDKRQDIEPGTPLYECHANCGM